MASVAIQDQAASDNRFLWRLTLAYACLTLVMLFTLDRFWSANWDVQIITDGVRSLWDGGSPFDLYAASRAKWPWPYPYPPLSALILVPFIGLADLLGGGSSGYGPLQLIAIRIPPLLADIAIAWLIHRILWRELGHRWMARLGAALWLFHPVLLYHTAVQGHQESTWMLPVLLAYDALQRRGLDAALRASLLLVVAIALKQSAAIYALPYLTWMLAARRWKEVARFALLFGLIFVLLALPWALYSGDFRALVFDEVRKMPVQVQSWQLWALAVEPFRVAQTETTFPTVRFAMPLILIAAALIGEWMRRAGRSWVAIGLAVTLCFVLISQKVMAYHYPMVLPWLILFALRAGRLRLLTGALVGLAWLLLSPYFAPWANPDHLAAYALLGTVNSLAFLWLLWQAAHESASPARVPQASDAGGLVGWMGLMAACMALASFAQPLRAPLLAALAPGQHLAGMVALLALLALLLLLLLPRLSRVAGGELSIPVTGRWSPALLAGALLLLPLAFTWFTMNAEITAVIERGLSSAWGLGG